MIEKGSSNIERDKAIKNAYKSFFRSEEGKIVLMDILTEGYVFDTRYITNRNDALFINAQRVFAMRIMKKADVNINNINDFTHLIR